MTGTQVALAQYAAQDEIQSLWEALRLIRQEVELLAPPGSVPAEETLLPEPGYLAEAIVQGVHALAGGSQYKYVATALKFVEALVAEWAADRGFRLWYMADVDRWRCFHVKYPFQATANDQDITVVIAYIRRHHARLAGAGELQYKNDFNTALIEEAKRHGMEISPEPGQPGLYRWRDPEHGWVVTPLWRAIKQWKD